MRPHTYLLLLVGFLIGTPTLPGQAKPLKVLFVGNSLTVHGPKPDIDWHGNWGMAASAEAKDYVHLVTQALTVRQGVSPIVMVKNVAEFERADETYDTAGRFADAAAFKADLIILAIGENVPPLATPAATKGYQERVHRLLTVLRGETDAQILVRSSFWADPAKDGAMRRACEGLGGTFVDISALARDEKNFARAELPYKHAGVASHPGDRGMAAIADAILRALK
jgi:alpha-galactosidase